MEVVGYKNYIEQLATEYPDVDKNSIARVVRHGLCMINFLHNKGADILLNHNTQSFYFYFGEYTNTLARKEKAAKRKLPQKFRLLQSLKKVPFVGTYYYTLSESCYQLHLAKLPIPKLLLYRSKDECVAYGYQYLFQVQLEDVRSWRIYKEDCRSTGTQIPNDKRIKYEAIKNTAICVE